MSAEAGSGHGVKSEADSEGNVTPVKKPTLIPVPNHVVSKGVGIRVDKLASILKKHQEIIYRQENVSKYFESDSEMLRVVENCWHQIHGKIGDVIESKHHNVMEGVKVLDKLSQLDNLKDQGKEQSGNPAWRPSGNPQNDFDQAASTVIRISAIPEFEKMYSEVQNVTGELEDLIKGRQQELLALETQISDKIKKLNADSMSSLAS